MVRYSAIVLGDVRNGWLPGTRGFYSIRRITSLGLYHDEEYGQRDFSSSLELWNLTILYIHKT